MTAQDTTRPVPGSLVVAGAVTRDTLIYPGRLATESLGGILYNVMALAGMTNRQITPVANVGADVYDEAIRLLEPYPNVSTCGLRRVPSQNVHSYIMFASEYGTQYDEGRVEPVTYGQLEPHLEAALILATFPSGFDMNLAVLRRLAASAAAPIYLDYHILALGRDSMGNRYLKRRRDWIHWLACATFVQLNLFEAEHLAGRRLSDDRDLLRLAAGVLQAGPRIVTITLGAQGSFVAYWQKGEIAHACIAAAAAPKAVDPTGCGDVYSAAFVVRFLDTGDVEDASRVANRMAALKASTTGLESIGTLFRLAAEGECSRR